MNDDERLEMFLDAWQEARARGEAVAPEDLCRGCPELLSELLRRVAVLCLFDALRAGREAVAQGRRLALTDRVAASPPVLGEPAPAARPPGLPAVGQEFGGYRIEALLGAGGMGRVYQATESVLRRAVALKVMRPEVAAHPHARERFLREGRALAALQHDHVATIYQVGEADGVPFLTMPLLRGESLADRLKRETVLPAAEVLRIGREAAEGLAAVHAAGLLHRDVKPSNLWLEADTGRVKLLDFGLAREQQGAEALTEEGTVVGTPEYMSPEQGDGLPLDARSDLYSLGSVLYTLCTGHPPFRAGHALAVLKHVCEATPPPIRESNPDIPDWLAAIIDKLLAKDPAARFRSAAEVAGLLGQHLAHLQQPQAVPRPAAVTAGRQGPRRRRTSALLAAAALLLAAVVLLGWSGRLVGPVSPRGAPEGESKTRQPEGPETTADGPAAEAVSWAGEGPRALFADPAHSLQGVLDWRELVGANLDEFRNWAAALGPDFRVALVTNHRGRGTARFNAVAVRESNPPSSRFFPELSHSKETAPNWKKQREDDFRPALVCGYLRADPNSPGADARLWVKDNLGFAYWSLPRDDFLARMALHKAEGLRPTHLDALMLPEGLRYRVVLISGQLREWKAFYALKPEDLLATVAFYRGKGWRPDVLAPYWEDERLRFMLVVVDNSDGVDWRFRTDMSLPQYQEESAEQKRQGLFPLALTSYGEEADVRYAAIWVRYRLPDRTPE
jgi:serine/threonine-protein kinase